MSCGWDGAENTSRRKVHSYKIFFIYLQESQQQYNFTLQSNNTDLLNTVHIRGLSGQGDVVTGVPALGRFQHTSMSPKLLKEGVASSSA